MSSWLLSLLLSTQAGHEKMFDMLYQHCIFGAWVGSKETEKAPNYKEITSYCWNEADNTLKELKK